MKVTGTTVELIGSLIITLTGDVAETAVKESTLFAWDPEESFANTETRWVPAVKVKGALMEAAAPVYQTFKPST